MTDGFEMVEQQKDLWNGCVLAMQIKICDETDRLLKGTYYQVGVRNAIKKIAKEMLEK